MATWKTANFASVVPSTLTSIIHSAEAVASAASAILTVFKTGINIAKAFVISFPAFEWAAALAIAVKQFENDFFAAGFSMLNMWDYPIRQLSGLTFSQHVGNGIAVPGANLVGPFNQTFESDAAKALVNRNDPGNPNFNSDCAALVLVAAFGTGQEIEIALKTIRDAFTWWKEIGTIYSRMTRLNFSNNMKDVSNAIIRGDIQFTTSPHAAINTQKLLAFNEAVLQAKNTLDQNTFENKITPIIPSPTSDPGEILKFVSTVQTAVAQLPYPHFQGESLRTIFPFIKELADEALDPFLAALSTGRSINDVINSILSTLDTKITQLNNIVSAINSVLQTIDNLTALSNVSALYISSRTGMTDLAAQLKAATNKPLGSGSGLFTGIVLVGGGPGLTPFNNVFKPLGS